MTIKLGDFCYGNITPWDLRFDLITQVNDVAALVNGVTALDLVNGVAALERLAWSMVWLH